MKNRVENFLATVSFSGVKELVKLVRDLVRQVWTVIMLFLFSTCGGFCPAVAYGSGNGPGGRKAYRAEDIVKSVLVLTGASEPESLEAHELERYEYMASHPVLINMASASKLSESGLFSRYRIASLLEYRSEYGDIMSIAELAAIDGFGEEFAMALKPFVSFYSKVLQSANSLPGASTPAGFGGGDGQKTIDNSLIIRSAFRGQDWNYGLKYRCTSPRIEVAGTMRNTFADPSPLPSSYSFFSLLRGRRRLEKLIVGDFNLRLGQGLGLWSGFSLGGFSSSSSFYKRPTGISPSWSYSPENCRGTAAVFGFGHFILSAFASFPGLREAMDRGMPYEIRGMPGGNLTWYGRSGQVSVTSFSILGRGERHARVAADARFCVKGSELFGEVAYSSGGLAAVAGAVIPVAGQGRLSFAGRYYPAVWDAFLTGAVRAWTKSKDECALGAGFEWGKFYATLDVARRISNGEKQLKVLVAREFALKKNVLLKMRLSERLRTYGELSRTDFRADLGWQPGVFHANMRLNALHCIGTSWLGYAEVGAVEEGVSVYFRSTVFRADKWSDRIYCYERDAPGNFNVPAYYGSGYALSLYATGKLRLGTSFLKGYARLSWTERPWHSTAGKKTGVAELKLQLQYDF